MAACTTGRRRCHDVRLAHAGRHHISPPRRVNDFKTLSRRPLIDDRRIGLPGARTPGHSRATLDCAVDVPGSRQLLPLRRPIIYIRLSRGPSRAAAAARRNGGRDESFSRGWLRYFTAGRKERHFATAMSLISMREQRSHSDAGASQDAKAFLVLSRRFALASPFRT